MTTDLAKHIFRFIILIFAQVLIVQNINCDIVKGPVLQLTSQKWSINSIGVIFDEIWERYGVEIINGNYNITKEEREIVEKIFNE